MIQALRRFARHELAASLNIMSLRVGMLGAKFVLSLFIARYIGLDALGVYGLIVGIAGTLQAVVRGGVFNVLGRDAVHQTRAELTGHLRNYGVGILSVYLILLPVAVLIGWHFGRLEGALLGLCVCAIEHVAYDVFLLTNYLGRQKLANVILSVQSASWIYLYVILAFFIHSLRTLDDVLIFWVCGGVVMAGIISFATREWPWRAAMARPLEVAWYREKLAESWRLYISDVIAVLTMYMDRYLMSLFLSLEMTGVYVLFSQVTNAITNLVAAGILQIYKPRMIRAYKDGETTAFAEIYRTCFTRTIGGSVLLGVISGIVVPFLVVFTKKALALHYLPLLWLMLCTLPLRISSDIVAARLYAQHRDHQLMTRNVIGVFVAALWGALSLKLFGIYGVVLNMIVVNGVQILIVMFWPSSWRTERPK